MTFFASTTCCAADVTPVIKPFAIITPRTGKSMVDIAPDTAPDTAAVPNPYVRRLPSKLLVSIWSATLAVAPIIAPTTTAGISPSISALQTGLLSQ